MGYCNLIPQEQRCLPALIVTAPLRSNPRQQLPSVSLVANTPLRIGLCSFVPEFGLRVSAGVTRRLSGPLAVGVPLHHQATNKGTFFFFSAAAQYSASSAAVTVHGAGAITLQKREPGELLKCHIALTGIGF